MRRIARWVLLAVGLCVAGILAWRLLARPSSQTAGQARGGPAAEGRPVPVLPATVERRDVPIYLEGLGTVIAFKTVTVTSQVDGRLVSVPFIEGQVVKKGDLLAQVDPRPFQIQLQQAEAAQAKDSAALHDNRLNLERYVTLRKENLIQQQTVDDQQALVAQGEAQVRADEAQIGSAKLNLEYSRITSPIDGVTGVRLVDPGNVVRAAAGNGIVVVTQVDPIAVLFTLPEDVLPQVFRQMSQGPLSVLAQSRDGSIDLATGKVALVDNQINQSTGTIRLKAVFDNPKRLLWPNQFVKVRLLLEQRKDVLVVPAPVVQRGPQGTFAYVIGPDLSVSQRPITVATTEADLAIIEDGLQQGEMVVTDGQFQLKPGAKVVLRQAGEKKHAAPGQQGQPAPIRNPPVVEPQTGPAGGPLGNLPGDRRYRPLPSGLPEPQRHGGRQ